MTTDWVCPDCGLDYGTLHPPHAINALRSFPRRYAEALPVSDDDDKPDALIRRRPAPDVWSAIEYAAHVADLLAEFVGVVHRMAYEDNPRIDFFDPDERAATDHYNEQNRAAVLDRLTDGATRLAKEAGAVDADSWHRLGTFAWGERDLLTMLRNAVHEGVHHLRDIEVGLAKARGEI